MGVEHLLQVFEIKRIDQTTDNLALVSLGCQVFGKDITVGEIITILPPRDQVARDLAFQSCREFVVVCRRSGSETGMIVIVLVAGYRCPFRVYLILRVTGYASPPARPRYNQRVVTAIVAVNHQRQFAGGIPGYNRITQLAPVAAGA